MQYQEAVDSLLHRFPVLREPYDRLVKRYKNINEMPGAHVVYGDLFCDYIIDLVAEEELGIEKLKVAAEFIEQLAGNKDPEVRNLMEVSVLERLADEKVAAIIPFLGRNSAKLLKNISHRLHLDDATWGKLAKM